MQAWRGGCVPWTHLECVRRQRRVATLERQRSEIARLDGAEGLARLDSALQALAHPFAAPNPDASTAQPFALA